MDEQLVRRAAELLSVTDLVPLREGGQKFVAVGSTEAQERVVLKVIGLESSPNPTEVLERARREVGLLAEIDHRNIVRLASDLTSVGDPAVGVAWLEEYLEGEDLGSRLRRPWDWADVNRLGLDLARGLSVLHEREVVHRDLSPNNVRCVVDGRYVILDPGYARHLELATLTVNGQPGTPGFLSPEHLTPSGPLPASDVFCVGILLFAALTGDLPIPLTGDIDVYQRMVRQGHTAALRPVRPDLTDDQASIVERCLDPHPARRYLDGEELRLALEGL